MNFRAISVSVFFLLLTITFLYCKSNKKEGQADAETTAPLTISGNTDAFNQSFTRLLTAYYSLKDALIEGDTVKVNAAAATVFSNAGSLNINEIKGDSTGMITETAKLFAETINGSAEALMAEKDLEAKRREFNMITDAMWSLTRTVRYEGQKVYYQYCPTALDNSGAYWLSDTNEIRNPYTGNQSPACGEVTDSLDYSNK